MVGGAGDSVSAAALRLARLLAEPDGAAALDERQWGEVIAIARAELLLGTLAVRVAGLPLPPGVAPILADAAAAAEANRRAALWEAQAAARALAPLGLVALLLKGTAYLAAGLEAGRGRSVGDLDLLVPRDRLAEAEGALLAAGWEWVKPDSYDDAYYRRWMHELPPLIHRERDRMADVHHTILPLTARPTPDAAALVAAAVPLGADGEGRLATLSPADMIVHAAAHLIADGDLAGGLRNLWDIDRLCREFGDDRDIYADVHERARRHGLGKAVARALRLAQQLYGTPASQDHAPAGARRGERWSDRLFRRRLLARDGWGRPTRPAIRLSFYVRSHALRMPPAMLARHLWVKWRRAGDRGPPGA